MYQLQQKHPQQRLLLHPHPQASNFALGDGPTIGVRSTLISNQMGVEANGG
jgi:hypothetical protein